MNQTKPEPEWGKKLYSHKQMKEIVSHSQASLLERVEEWVNNDNNADGWWVEGKDMRWTVRGDQLIKFLDKLRRDK